MLAVAVINLGLSLWVFGFATRHPNAQA
jgi:hypothetical protein